MGSVRSALGDGLAAIIVHLGVPRAVYKRLCAPSQALKAAIVACMCVFLAILNGTLRERAYCANRNRNPDASRIRGGG